MAGDWIKMRNDLAEDPAVIGMAAQLGVDEFSVIGRLHALWAWADRQSRDGHAHGVTTSWIDRKVQRDGFADAMVTVGWLLITDDGISIPNFAVHNGESAKTRALGTVRKQKQRSVTALSPEVSRIDRDKNETREEKRREEKKETNTAPAGAFELPSWIPSDTWASYCKVRSGKKAKNEPHALGLIIKDLERFRSAGHDPVEVLNNSIKSGWAGVFEPKTKPGAQPVASTCHDPDSRSAIEAEGVAKGIGPWNEINEQWHSYKARVRGKQNGLDLTQLAAMAAQRGVH